MAPQRPSPLPLPPLTHRLQAARLSQNPVSDGLAVALREPIASEPVTVLNSNQVGRSRPWIGSYMMSKPSYPLNIVLDEDEHKALEVWRGGMKLTTQSAAVVELMRVGLESQGFAVGKTHTYTDWSKLFDFPPD